MTEPDDAARVQICAPLEGPCATGACTATCRRMCGHRCSTSGVGTHVLRAALDLASPSTGSCDASATTPSTRISSVRSWRSARHRGVFRSRQYGVDGFGRVERWSKLLLQRLAQAPSLGTLERLRLRGRLQLLPCILVSCVSARGVAESENLCALRWQPAGARVADGRLVTHVVRHACFLGDAFAAQPRQPEMISIKTPERSRFRRDFGALVGIQHTGD